VPDKGDRVPAEFVGLARQFRREVMEDDRLVDAALARIATPLRRRLAKKPGLRPAMGHDTARAWTTLMPPTFRFDMATELGRSCLSISELRLTGSRWRSGGWANDEPGVSVLLLSLGTGTGKVAVEVRPVATLGLHALARRYQRGEGRDHPDIMRDLAYLATPPAGSADAVATGSGFWLGGVVWADDDCGRRIRLRSVRTFIAAEQVPDGHYVPTVSPLSVS
jgi:hypothetical protein